MPWANPATPARPPPPPPTRPASRASATGCDSSGAAVPLYGAAPLSASQRASLAVVRDATGRPTGMVTLDDLLARYLQPQVA
ncbi:hypothetical protein ABT063_41500 [Streptomyces sp. NPDC002838]|uniref:hypothetical protein n=1 Tax=Streptomyces sp. NPDC002838 TaxID=3154436 RepID=UPI00331BD07B